MSIAAMDCLTHMSRQFHTQLRGNASICQCGGEAVAQSVEGPPGDFAGTTALDGLQIYAGLTDDALETLTEPVSASGSFVCHARHDENVRLVRGRQFVHVGLKLRMQRDSDLFACLALNVSNRSEVEVHIFPFHAAAV